MSHVKSFLAVAVICFVVIAVVNRVDMLKRVAYPS